MWRCETEPTPTASAAERGALPARVDTVVVGSGYAGVVAAHELARRGRSVLVCEAERIGSGASTRNAGMVIPELKRGAAWLERHHGTAGRRMADSPREACELVAELAAELSATGLGDCGYRATGGVVLAHHPRAVAMLRSAARDLELTGLRCAFLERDELAAELESGAYPAGLLVDAIAGLHPERYHAALVRRALATGAALAEANRVLRIERAAGRFVVRTERGPVEAGDVLVVTNAYADGLVPALARGVLPVGSFMIATEPLDDARIRSVDPHRRMFFDTRHLLSYWRRGPGDRLVFGGRTSLSSTTVAEARDRLYDLMLRVYPQLAGVRVEHAWGGAVAITRDRLPHAGRIDGVAFATGCNGTGVALGTWLGRTMATWMLGEGPPPVFAEGSVPLRSWPRGLPRALPAAGLGLRLLDRLGR